MLQGQMAEAQSRRIQIDDVESPSVLEAMLRYFYTGETPLKSSGGDCALLMALGHKYGAEGLVDAAGREMLTRLTADNIAGIVRILRPYSDDELMEPFFTKLLDAICQDRELAR